MLTASETDKTDMRSSPSTAVLLGSSAAYTILLGLTLSGVLSPLTGMVLKTAVMIPWALVMFRRPEAALPNSDGTPFVNDMQRLWRRIGFIMLVLYGLTFIALGLMHVAMVTADQT